MNAFTSFKVEKSRRDKKPRGDEQEEEISRPRMLSIRLYYNMFVIEK